jgi:lysophospholipase
MTLVSLGKNPVPGGALVGTCKGYDGAEMRFARWDATRAPLRGTVVIVPGRTEFIEKYFEVVADLRRRGFAVAIMDLRGQGRSHRALADRQKGHIGSFREYEMDVERFVADVVVQSCPSPYIALGHSMGGHVLLRMASDKHSPFARMVLSAPLIRVHPSQLGRSQGVARLATEFGCVFGASARYVPGGGPPEAHPQFEGNLLTSDRERFQRANAVLEAAPDLAIGSPTVGWLRACLRSTAALQAPDYPSSVRVPLLLVAAGDDKIVSTPEIEEFALRLKLGTHVLIGTSRHEILQENDEIRGRFWAAFDAYVTDATASS